MKQTHLALLISLAFAVAVAMYAVFFFEGAARIYRLWYYAPAALVVGLLNDPHPRLESFSTILAMIHLLCDEM